jgi:ribosomal protein S17
MAEATSQTEKVQGRRKDVVGEVVSNRMHKTIVVQVTRKKATSAIMCGLKRPVPPRS